MPPIVSLPSGKGAIPCVGDDAMKSREQVWRPEPESNRRARICSPLRNHSAIGPQTQESVETAPLAVSFRDRNPIVSLFRANIASVLARCGVGGLNRAGSARGSGPLSTEARRGGKEWVRTCGLRWAGDL